MQADRLIDLLVQLASTLDIVWSKPAPDSFGLEIGVEAVCEVQVFNGVADEK
jgi:hypothetical protein